MSAQNGAQQLIVDDVNYSSIPGGGSELKSVPPGTVTATVTSLEPKTNNDELSEKRSIFGSFYLQGSEFALPVSVVQEVVNDPGEYSSVPLSPDYLVGLFNLRGSVIPVIDLSRIFKLNTKSQIELESASPPHPETSREECAAFGTRKVAILEHGNLCLGLLFDATGEVFNEKDVEICLFEEHSNTVQDQVIAGVFKMDGGSRIVQLLDVAGMLNLDRIPQSKHQGNISAFSRNRGKRRQCISFEVGDSCCAFDIGAIKEIVNIGKIENTVLAGSLCLGAIDLRGNTVPIINFSSLLGYGDSATDEIEEADSHRVIIMKVDDNLFGLLVSKINNIVSYFDDELVAFPVLGNKKSALFRGCVSWENQQLNAILLEQSEIFSNDEIQDITKGHSSLFRDRKESSFTEKQGSLNRKTLITFSLGSQYGLNIDEVKEVIDFPRDLIKTPTMTKHIRGMANLRGELVAIIDTRNLYDLTAFEDYENTKVLVFTVDDVKYGLMVDTVDSIVPYREQDVVAIPRVVFSAENGIIDKDVKEAIIVQSGSKDQTVCVLNLESVSIRASSELTDLAAAV